MKYIPGSLNFAIVTFSFHQIAINDEWKLIRVTTHGWSLHHHCKSAVHLNTVQLFILTSKPKLTTIFKNCNCKFNLVLLEI